MFRILLLIICLNSYRIIFGLMTEEKLPSQSQTSASRLLQMDEFQSLDGSIKLPLSYNGDSTWAAKIPIPDSDTVKTVMISLYSHESWFYENDEIARKATCANKIAKENMLFNQFEGMRCSVLTKLSKEGEINYKFLYSNESSLPLPAGTLGIIGFGINKDSLPLQVKPQSQMFSIYLHKEYPSYILFGKIENSFMEDQPPKIIQPLSAKNWSFAMSNFQIIQSPSPPFNLKIQQSQAILDFNHDFIGIPQQYFKDIFSNKMKTCTIESSRKSFLCDCSQLKSIKKFEFTLGKQDLRIPNSSLIEDFGEKCRIKIGCITSSSLDPNCIFVSENFENVWVLGTPFLSYFYPAFTYRTDSEKADVSFYIAKTKVDFRQVLAGNTKLEQKSALTSTLKDLITVIGAFAALFIVYFILKKGFAFLIEKKKKFYAKYQQEELEEGGEEDETRQQMENDNL